jgi:NAD(P)-dependent dehydrogenase (short-subunit alcohol dehydrogenase family)
MNPYTGRKTLLLTGAAGLLGTELIRLASSQLDIVALVHRRSLQTASTDTLSFSLDEGRHQSLPVRAVECDLMRQQDIVATLKTISTFVDRVDYVVNAAGDSRFLGSTTDAMTMTDDARRQFELHVFAPAVICSTLFHFQWKNIPVAEQRVSILNISSVSGSKVFKDVGQGFYAASKAATNMLTTHMAADYAPYGIRVNALSPNSFPSLVKTDVVASNALQILSSDKSGQLFGIG